MLLYNTEYEISFTGNPDIEFDKFLMTTNDSIPVGFDSLEVNTRVGCSATGIENTLAGMNLVIYPVPAKDLVHVKIPEPKDIRIKRIQVLSMLGQPVNNFTFSDKAVTEATIDLTVKTEGIYMIEVETNKGRLRKKLVLSAKQ